MANPVALNNIAHKDLRIVRQHTPALNESLMITLALPFEFRRLQHEYPIVFYKDERKQSFHAVALLGLQQNENLYLTEAGWDASYVPLMIERQPFLIGMRGPDEQGESQPVLLVDLDSPKVSEVEGEPLFLPHGGHSEYLQQVTNILNAIREREAETAAFHQALIEHDLLESFFLDISLDGTDKHRLAGYYTINEDKLRELEDSAVLRLHHSGMLQLIHFVLASQANFAGLIERKRAQVGASS